MFNFFGVKVGKNASITDCWICSEFLKIGDNVKIGQGACVYHFMMEPEKLLVAKVVIEDNVISWTSNHNICGGSYWSQNYRERGFFRIAMSRFRRRCYLFWESRRTDSEKNT